MSQNCHNTYVTPCNPVDTSYIRGENTMNNRRPRVILWYIPDNSQGLREKENCFSADNMLMLDELGACESHLSDQ